MKERAVVYSEEASDDLNGILDWLMSVASPTTAYGYVYDIRDHCDSLYIGSERGHRRDDLREGLRVIGYKRRVTILFQVEEERVVILRILYGGQNWEPLMRDG